MESVIRFLDQFMTHLYLLIHQLVTKGECGTQVLNTMVITILFKKVNTIRSTMYQADYFVADVTAVQIEGKMKAELEK